MFQLDLGDRYKIYQDTGLYLFTAALVTALCRGRARKDQNVFTEALVHVLCKVEVSNTFFCPSDFLKQYLSTKCKHIAVTKFFLLFFFSTWLSHSSFIKN